MTLTSKQIQKFSHAILTHAQIALQYADPKVLIAVKNEIPEDILYAFDPDNPFSTVKATLKWFKNFMYWNKSPKMQRHNSVIDILKTREGRCGEWANLYTAVLNAIGIHARLVLDFTDHVWTEYYDENYGWRHVDVTIPTVGDPLYYQKVWKKKLSFVIAFGPDKIEDRTRYYTDPTGNTDKAVNRRRKSYEALFSALGEAYFIGTYVGFHNHDPEWKYLGRSKQRAS